MDKLTDCVLPNAEDTAAIVAIFSNPVHRSECNNELPSRLSYQMVNGKLAKGKGGGPGNQGGDDNSATGLLRGYIEMEKELRMAETKTNMVVVIHFVKGTFNFPIPVETGDMDTPLIDLVRRAKNEHKIFFAFSESDCDHLKDKKGEIGISCKEANLKVTLSDLRNDKGRYTVNSLYYMTDDKTNHHHISFFIQPILSIDNDEFFMDIEC